MEAIFHVLLCFVLAVALIIFMYVLGTAAGSVLAIFRTPTPEPECDSSAEDDPTPDGQGSGFCPKRHALEGNEH